MDKKIPDTSDLAKKTDLNAKITEMEDKIPSISELATNSALTADENKIPNVSSLVTKSDYSLKISEIEKKVSDHDHGKYVTTPEFNKLTTENFKARLSQADLVTKTDFDTELKKISDRVTSNKSKHLLVETELRKLQKIDASYFRGGSRFEEDGLQNYLVFQPMYKCFKTIDSTESIAE